MSEENGLEWYYIKNWWKFQHYKDRRPPWIKLHRSLLTDPDIISLSPADRYHLIELWFAASDLDGRLPARAAYVRQTCGCGNDHVAELLLARLEAKSLISKTDVRGARRVRASELLALVRDRERERELNPLTPFSKSPFGGTGINRKI